LAGTAVHKSTDSALKRGEDIPEQKHTVRKDGGVIGDLKCDRNVVYCGD
jgi:hypothetical protein